MMFAKMPPYRWALFVVALVAGILLWCGVQQLFIPPIYKLAERNNPFLYYEGYIFIGMSATIACFYRCVARQLVRAAQEIHRWIHALLMVGVLGMDAMMHVFNIPHMEGWWLPLLGGSAVSFMSGLIKKLKRKSAE